MKNFVFIVAALLLGCSKPLTQEAIIGTWELTFEEGYEVYNGTKDEWNEVKSFSTFVFEAGNTGKQAYTDSVSDIVPIEWVLTDNTLIVKYPDAGDTSSYSVESLSGDTLILVQHSVDDGYEYYNRQIYKKRR